MQTAKKRKLHLRLSRRLYAEVRQTARFEGRTTPSQAEFDLEVILPVVQAEKRYRLAPNMFDWDSPACELTTQLNLEYYEVLEETALNSGLSVNQQACELLWFVAERRILEYVRLRFARIQ